MHCDVVIVCCVVWQSKQVELQFSIATALVWAALGPKAPVARDTWSQTEAEFEVLGNRRVVAVVWLVVMFDSKPRPAGQDPPPKKKHTHNNTTTTTTHTHTHKKEENLAHGLGNLMPKTV